MIPRVPAGATAASVFVAYRRCSAVRLSDSDIPRTIPWPRNAMALSDRLSGAISASTLIEEHSMAPLFNAFCLGRDPSKLIKAQTAGKPTYGGMPPRAAFCLELPLRRCPQCVQRDLEAFGFAHWYVHHQVRQVRHCAEHRCALESVCARCERVFLYSLTWQGADEGCWHCGAETGLPDPDDRISTCRGYWSLLEAIQGCLRGYRDIVVRRPMHAFNAYRKRETVAQTHARIDGIVNFFGARTDEEFAALLGFDFFREDLLDIFRAREDAAGALRNIYATPIWLALCVYCRSEEQTIARDASVRLEAARNDPEWDYLDLIAPEAC
ncbi:hypothetical protein ACSFBX_11220 [Variovorax sp. RB2P76]|uniref:hypothetical protein n=1 Tax=Variovorax sp. RB2P76 TaxID=3443736 RepID=UPI003F46C0F4